MRKQAGVQFESNSFEQHAYDNAAQITTVLTSAPTTQAEGLQILPKHGDEGYFNNIVYKNMNGVIKKWSVTSV